MGLTKPKITGNDLPVLSNAATADIIPAGFEAIDGLGALIVGTGEGLGDASPADVISGKTFTSVEGLQMVGEAIAAPTAYDDYSTPISAFKISGGTYNPTTKTLEINFRCTSTVSSGKCTITLV